MDDSQELSEEEQWDLEMVRRRQRGTRLNPVPIRSVMQKLVAQRGYGQTEVANQLGDAWAKAAGEALAPLTRPGKVSRGVLLVIAENSAAMQELAFQKRRVLESLNASLSEMKITDIRTRVGRIR